VGAVSVAVVTVLAVPDFINPKSGTSPKVLVGEPDAGIEYIGGHASAVVVVVPSVGSVERQIALIDTLLNTTVVPNIWLRLHTTSVRM
jgi:hypothetical protein